MLACLVADGLASGKRRSRARSRALATGAVVQLLLAQTSAILLRDARRLRDTLAAEALVAGNGQRQRAAIGHRDAPAAGERDIAGSGVDIGATGRGSGTRAAREGGAAIDGDRAFVIVNVASLLRRVGFRKRIASFKFCAHN